MPWRIERNKGKCAYAVVKESDGSVVGCHPTEDKAKAHMRALYANEPKKALRSDGRAGGDNGGHMDTIFKIFAPTMIASRGDDGKLRIEGIASSNVRDSHGDQITRKALEKMAGAAKGLTIFLNHKYDVPEDVFGTVERVKLERSGQIDPLTKEEIYDLRMGIVVQKANPRAVQAFEQMEAGPDKVPTKLGLSIGAMVPDGGAKFDKSTGGRYIVDDLDLVETSLVSIPANPRSWIDYAVKSLAKNLAAKNDGLPVMITKQRGALAELMEAEGVQIVDGVDEGELVPDPEEHVAEADGVEKTAVEAPADGTEVELTEDDPSEEHTQPEVNDSASDDEGEELEQKSDVPVDDSSISRNTQKTKVTVWDGDKTVEVDTGRSKPKDSSAQADDGSENAGSSGTTKSEDPEMERLLVASLETSDSLTKALRGQLLAARAENDTLREERDAALKLAEMTLTQSQALIEKVSEMPTGRRAIIAETVAEDFTKFREDLYSADVLKQLKKG